jgi:hypothetical protein
LSLPGLTAEGDFTLSNIRLVKDGTTVSEADPKTVNIHCLGEILISSVTSTPMTMQELRDAGVQLQPGNYEGRRFTMALAIGSQQVSLTVPVAVPVYNGLEDPRGGGGEVGRLEITGFTDRLRLPDLSVVVADITPEKDPFSLSRPAISHVLQHNFKALIVIPGSIGYLHQFYKANLVVFNALKEGSPFQITHLSATLNLPPGGDGAVGTLDDPLRLVQRDGETDAVTKAVRGPGVDGVAGTGDPLLLAGQSGMATFFVEALKEGAHQLNFDIRGQFEGGGLSEPVPLLGHAQGKLLVRNPNFSLVLVHPDVVRRGEEYTLEARLTNTSQTLANGVTVTLDRSRLGNVKLVEDLNTPVDTLNPGETAVFKFKLRALRNGEVRSSYLYMEQGTIGFQLSTGLGERNIRLNPDTLVLPQTLEGRNGLPLPLREAMLRVLGQAYSVASTKGALPPGVFPIAMSSVTGQMSQDLSEQGLFIKMGIDKARVWMRLWEMFIQNSDTGFDQLVRTTDAGRELREAFVDAWTWADPNRPMPDRLGEMIRWNSAFGGMAVAAVDGAGPGLRLELQDAVGNRIVSGDVAIKDLPYLPQPQAAWGGTASRHWISMRSPSPWARLSVINRSTEAQSLRLAVAAPVAGSAPTYNLFELELAAGQSAVITLGEAREGTAVYLAPDGTSMGSIYPSQTSDLQVEPFKVLAVHRYDIELDPSANPYGTHVMMLFNRPTMALDLPSGEDGFNAAKALVQVDANAPWRKILPPDPDTGEASPPPPALFKASARAASLYLERPVGPYVPRQLTLASTWTDDQGSPLTGDLSWPILCGDVPGGALVRGKVRKANASGLPAKMTYWYQAASQAGNVDLATGYTFLDEEVLTHYALVSNFDTDADGSYQLDYVPEPVSFAVGPMLLKGTTAEGTVWAQASVLGNGQLIEMDLVLEGKGSVDGYVLSAAGAPVAGAQVQVIQEQPSNPLTQGTGGGTFVQSTTTGVDGHYRVDNLKTGVFSIRALKDLFGAAASNEISRDGEIVHQNVVLESPTGTLKARLLDTSGQVVLTQIIRLGIASGLLRSSGSGASLVWPEQATPGADGWVTFSNVPAGDVGLIVPYLPMGTVSDWRGFLDPGTAQEITLKMLPPTEQAFAHFLVVDATGNPVPGVYLSDGSRGFAITDENGTAPKRPVPAGQSFQISTYHPAWPGQTKSESVVVQAGEDRLIRTTLPPRGTLHGTVKYPDGTPVRGAYVAIPPVFDDMTRNRLAITDATGAFLLPNVQVGSPFRLAAVGPELRTAMPPMNVQVADGQDLGLNLTLPFLGKNQVSGVIYQPLEGAQKIPTMAQVWVDGLLPIIAPSTYGNGDWGLFSRGTTGAMSTGVEGKYTFTSLPQGIYTLHANSDLFPVEVKSGGDFADKANDAQTRDIYLSSSFAGELKGVIYKRDGQTPVAPDVRVRLIGGTIGELIIFTTDGGKYHFPKVIPAGCYKLRVEDPVIGDIAVTKVEMAKESSQVKNLRLWGKGTLTVRVQDSFGQILPEGVVTLIHSKAGSLGCPPVAILDVDDLPPMAQKLKPEMEGVLIFEDILEGPISVGLKNPTGLQGVATVSIPEGGGNAEVVVRLQPVGDVLGTLYRADGSLVSAGRVDAYLGDRWLGVSPTRMDGVNGRFRFEVLPTGPISLEAWDPDSRQMGKGVVNVVAGQTAEIVITTHDKGPVVVTVTQEGQAVIGAAIRLAYRGGDALDFTTESTSDGEGRATFYVPPGNYTATATDPLSLATGSVAFSRDVDQGEIQTSIVLQAVRSLWATALPPPGAPAGFSLEGWSLRDSAMGRLVKLDAKGQGMLRDLPVGDRTLKLTDLRGRWRGDFTTTLSVEGGTVQTPVAPLQAVAYGNLDVKVVDAHGQLAPNVAVYASGGGTISTDGAGIARFFGLLAGNLSLWGGGASGTALLQQEEETVQAQLQLPPIASMHGAVYDSMGQPMPYVLVSVGVLQTATDGQGQFRVSGMGLGTYTVTALSSSGRRAAVSVTLDRADQDAEVRLDFPPQGSLTGIVRDPLRAVSPPIHVMVYLAGGGNPVGDTYTNDQGAFRFPSLPAGKDLRVVGILDDGRTEVFNQTFALDPQEGATLNLDLTMPILVNVKGWTLDALGNKIPMTVLLLDDQGRTLDKAVTTGDIFDPDHPTFFFRYLLAGHRYRLMGLQEMTGLAIAYLDYIPAGDKDLDELTLQAQARRGVKLQVRYPDGTPTPGPGHLVVTSQSVLGGRWEGSLGSDGSALIEDLPEGPATVSLTGVPNQPTLGTAFSIPGESAVYEVTVPAIGLGTLVVKVQTTSGRLLSGGLLTAQGSNTPRWIGVAQGDGTYRLEGVWIGTPLSLQATGFGLVGNAPVVTLTQHGQQVSVTYPAPDQGSLSGVVRDSRGIPVAGALVSTAGRTTTTDAIGGYTLTALPLGGYSVVVTIPNRVDRAVLSAVLGSDGQSLILDVPLKGTGAVRVHVVRPDKSPVSGQFVSVRNISTFSDGRVLTAATDTLGVASFNEVLEGDIRANAVIDGVDRAAAGSLVAGGTLTLDIQTKDISFISGRVRRASATTWPTGSTVKILGAIIPLQPDGTLAGLAPTVDFTPSSIPVLVSVGGSRDINVGSVYLLKNGTTSLDLTAPPFGLITGVVKDARGTLVSDATVSTTGSSASTNAQGVFQIDGLTLGSYQLMATVPNRVERGLADGNISFDGEVRTYNIALKGTGTVRVMALAADGTPLLGQTVRLRNYSAWSDGSSLSAATDTQGLATFTGVLEGSITATANLLERDYYQSGTLNLDGTLNLTLKVRDFTTFSGCIRRANVNNVWPMGTKVSLAGQSYDLGADGTLLLPTPNPQADFGNGITAVYVNVPNGIQLTLGSLSLVKDGETVLDLAAPGYGSLFGTVKLQSGGPAANVPVRVDNWTYLTTDGSGVWLVPMTTTGQHHVVAQTSTSIASGEVTLADDGGAAGIDLTLIPNTVSLPVYMALNRLGSTVSIYSDGTLAPPNGPSSRAFLSVDGASEISPTAANGIAQWIERDRQLAYTAQMGPVEVSVIRTVAPDAVFVKEEIRFRNTDSVTHRVMLRHAVSLSYVQGIPSGEAQPVLAGTSRDSGLVSYNGTVLWGNGAISPTSVDANGIHWPDLTVAPGEVKILAMAYAPYQRYPYPSWGIPRFRKEGASTLLARVVHGAPEWAYGSDPAAWVNWLPPQDPPAPVLVPWDATLNLTLKDAFGNRVKNRLQATFQPRESLAPTNVDWTGYDRINLPRDGGQVSFTLPGSPSIPITRDLATTGLVDILITEGASLSVSVTDSHGNPMPSAPVSFVGPGYSGSTDTNGNTGLYLMAPGSCTVQATMPGSDSTVMVAGSVTLGAGQSQQATLTFPAVGTFQVVILGPTGATYSNWVNAYVKSNTTGTTRWSSASGGLLNWSNLVPGTYALYIQDPRTNGYVVPIQVVINADAVTQSTVQLPGLGQIQVVVLDPLGNRVPRGRYVSAQGPDGGSAGGYTDDSGTVLLSNLAPGLATLSSSNPSNGFTARIQIQVMDGQITQATLQLPGSATLRVTITTTDGRPVPNRYFYVQQSGSNIRSGYTDANGQLNLGPLPTQAALVLNDAYGNPSDPFNPRVPPVSFSLSQDGEVQAKTLTLPLGILRVLVREAGTGSPLPNARIWYRYYWNVSANTDANGVVTFKDVALDTDFSVGADLSGYQTAQNSSVSVSSGQPVGALTLDLSKLMQIGFKVVRANGTDAPSFNSWAYRYWYYHLVSPVVGFDQQQGDISSVYTWTNVPSGDYTAETFALVGTGKDGTIQTSSGSTWPWKAKTQVSLNSANMQPTLTMQLPSLAAWTLHFKGEDGLPLVLNRPLSLVLKASTVQGYLLQDVSFNPAIEGPDLAMAEHFPEGTHTFSVTDALVGELASVNMVVKAEHDALCVEQNLTVPAPRLAALILHLRDIKGQPLQQDHGFHLLLKSSTRDGYALNLALPGADPACGLQFPEGTHTFAIEDSVFGEIHTFDLTVGAADIGNILERTFNLPYVHGTWAATARAGDRQTQVVGATITLWGPDSGFWMYLTPGVAVLLEVPNTRNLQTHVFFQPLGNLPPVELDGSPRTLGEGDLVNESLVLPLTVARFRLLDQDGQTPMADLAGNLVLADQDARAFPMPLWSDVQGATWLLLLGQPEMSLQSLVVFDSRSGLGKAVQVRIPAIGQALDSDQQIPAYAWLQLQFKGVSGGLAINFDVGVASSVSGIVAPWAAQWNSQGNAQLGPVRVPVVLDVLWSRSGSGQAPQNLVLAGLLPGETRSMEFSETQSWMNFHLNFYEAAGIPINPGLFGYEPYTISTSGALPEGWAEERGMFGYPDGGWHHAVSGVPFTVKAGIPNYGGRAIAGTVTDAVTEATNNKEIYLIMTTVMPSLTSQGKAQDLAARPIFVGSAIPSNGLMTEIVYPVPMTSLGQDLLLHLIEKLPAPPPKSQQP